MTRSVFVASNRWQSLGKICRPAPDLTLNVSLVFIWAQTAETVDANRTFYGAVVISQRRERAEAKPLANLIGKAITPVCRKRGFASFDLLAAWPDIVGERYAERVQPERILWPRRPSDDPEGGIDPATLVVHTDGATAMILSHEMPQVIERLNTFFGWAAIGRIKILQKPVRVRRRKTLPPKRELTDAETSRLEQQVAGVEDNRLREALTKLGQEVIGRGAANTDKSTPREEKP
ncbi:MAG: DUF721 domain-containing protein [Rhodobacteraceae bacterium]|nr:DUF721 domain-containing protein [Paracoccaceae bacterium]